MLSPPLSAVVGVQHSWPHVQLLAMVKVAVDPHSPVFQLLQPIGNTRGAERVRVQLSAVTILPQSCYTKNSTQTLGVTLLQHTTQSNRLGLISGHATINQEQQNIIQFTPLTSVRIVANIASWSCLVTPCMQLLKKVPQYWAPLTNQIRLTIIYIYTSAGSALNCSCISFNSSMFFILCSVYHENDCHVLSRIS